MLVRLGALVVLAGIAKKQWPRFWPPEERGGGGNKRQPISGDIYRRPDPLIYDQYYLQAQGFAVTWDNPDIWVEQNGTAVQQHDLQPDTEYEIVARIWNGSNDAPVVNLPVHFSYLSFGAGTRSHRIGTTRVDLGVRGSPSCPARATHRWRTPATPGHYCIQVELQWADDANPRNNLGQSNTDVQPVHSPARFTFLVGNHDGRRARRHTFHVDSYALPHHEPCGKTAAEEEKARETRVAAQQLDRHRPAEGWTVAVDPAEVDVEPGEEITVSVEVTPPAGFAGRQVFNVNVMSEERLVGGVTLIATS